MADGSLDTKVARYEPVDAGLSSTELKWAYFVTTHKVFFHALGIGFLVAVDAALVAYALVGFGKYLLGGQAADELAVRAVVARLQKSSVQKLSAAAAQPLVLGDAQVFSGSSDRYDFVSSVENPNDAWYALVTYQFDVAGASSTPTRTVYVLPKEKKYFTALGVSRPGESISGAALVVVNTVWRRINPHDYSNPQDFLQAHMKFSVTNASFTPGGTPGGTGATGAQVSSDQIKFTFTNDSAYNYWRVPVQITLLRAGTLVGIEETEIAQVHTGESRAVELRTFTPGLSADEVAVIPSVDVFDASVYMNQ